ncbi:MAG: nucleotide exchange factor GrpE [Candidatus Bipolaricaulota bacterium]
MKEKEQQPHETHQEQEEDLQAKLADKEQEAQDLREKLLRLRADFENYRKQVDRNMDALARRVCDQEILDFLPVYDSMESAFRAYRRAEDAQAFVEGMERIFAQFSEILERKGCRVFSSRGEKFDPARHEVLIAVESPEERDTILEEFERGWYRGDQVLRTAKVKASLGPEENTGGEYDGGDERESNRD